MTADEKRTFRWWLFTCVIAEIVLEDIHIQGRIDEIMKVHEAQF